MLEVDHLTRRFGDITAATDVTFTVPEGQLSGFVGANGAGKTTTMRMVMGVLAAHSGEVRWRGQVLTREARTRFGYMPEERGLYPKQPIIDQLVYLGRLRGMAGGAARTAATDLLGRFGLESRSRDKLESLSLGNQQRVQVAAAVLADPEVLILDEPFSGLDPLAVDAMTELLREHAARGVPVLFSSHQLDLVERLCDQLVIMTKSRVVASGTVEDLRSRGQVRHRLVLGSDAGWVRNVPGVATLDVDGAVALVEVIEPGADQHLLTMALARGEVREFARLVPTMAEIYREVTAA